MSKFVINITLFAWLSITAACCQSFPANIEPLELAQRMFNPNGFAALNQYSTGEYQKDQKGHPNGKDINQKNVTRHFQVLSPTPQQTVVNMTVTNQAGSSTDFYLYFVKEGV